MGSEEAVVGFVGLDAVSLEMASSLLCSGFKVQAFEIDGPLMDGFQKNGDRCSSPTEAAKGAVALIVLISHPDQINDLFFGPEGACKGLQEDAVVILHSTVLLSHIEKLEKRLTDECKVARVVDAYVFKGASDGGKLLITCSGKSDAVSSARPILSAISDKLFIFYEEIGAASKTKLVNELLEAIHLVASVEAISMGCKASVHPWIIYDIISNAAGNSWVFKNHVPHLLRGLHTKNNFLDPVIQNLGAVLDVAKTHSFPLPLLAVAHQQLVLAHSHQDEVDGDLPVIKIWEKVFGVDITSAANMEPYHPEQLAEQIIANSSTVKRIGFIGLGAMGFGMATNLLKKNFTVIGFDVYKPTLTRFSEAGGLTGHTPAEASKGIDVMVIMVTNETQAESVLFGESGAVSALPAGASIILSSTVSPSFVSQLERRLQGEGKGLKLVDAPVSGGVKRAAEGTLTIMASGTDEALHSTGSVLSAMSEKLYVIKGGCGAGSGVKMVNQLLAGVHIASAAEAMALGARLGLNTRVLFDVIKNSGGDS
ncbi:hypothetical protein CRG98_035416, partial [Punica granatum]